MLRTLAPVCLRLALLVAACACFSCHPESTQYRLERRSEPSSGFEGRRHWQELYFGDLRLGAVGQYSISPSGRFAAFEETGRLLLFDRESRETVDITDGDFALPKSFQWREGTGTLRVEYYPDSSHEASTIKLPD